MLTIEQVKEIYIKNNGSAHMGREYPEAYQAFAALNPDEDLLREWDEEILERLFASLWENTDSVWVKHNLIIYVLNRKRANLNIWLLRLLDEMEKMIDLDKKNKIEIIQNMGGRRNQKTEGGVQLICLNTNMESRMKDIMDKMKDFRCDEEDLTNSWLVALDSYEKACKKYCAGGKNL